jgi:hypothetical protein
VGINNLNLIINTSPVLNPDPAYRRLQEYQHILTEEHRAGRHPVGEMVRACPLCQTRA